MLLDATNKLQAIYLWQRGICCLPCMATEAMHGILDKVSYLAALPNKPESAADIGQSLCLLSQPVPHCALLGCFQMNY